MLTELSDKSAPKKKAATRKRRPIKTVEDKLDEKQLIPDKYAKKTNKLFESDEDRKSVYARLNVLLNLND